MAKNIRMANVMVNRKRMVKVGRFGYSIKIKKIEVLSYKLRTARGKRVLEHGSGFQEWEMKSRK